MPTDRKSYNIEYGSATQFGKTSGGTGGGGGGGIMSMLGGLGGGDKKESKPKGEPTYNYRTGGTSTVLFKSPSKHKKFGKPPEGHPINAESGVEEASHQNTAAAHNVKTSTAPFKLRSGNTTSFKAMGSSPAKFFGLGGFMGMRGMGGIGGGAQEMLAQRQLMQGMSFHEKMMFKHKMRKRKKAAMQAGGAPGGGDGSHTHGPGGDAVATVAPAADAVAPESPEMEAGADEAIA